MTLDLEEDSYMLLLGVIHFPGRVAVAAGMLLKSQVLQRT